MSKNTKNSQSFKMYINILYIIYKYQKRLNPLKLESILERAGKPLGFYKGHT